MNNVTVLPDQIKATQIQGIQKQIADLRAQEAELTGNPSLAVGLRLAAARKTSGDPAAKAAEKMEITANQLNQIESRGKGLTLSRFIAYCKIYDLDANAMLGLRGG